MSDKDQNHHQNHHRPTQAEDDHTSQEENSMNEKPLPETADEQDLYEELHEDEIREIIHEHRGKRKQTVDDSKPRRPFPKWVFGLLLFLWSSIWERLYQESFPSLQSTSCKRP